MLDQAQGRSAYMASTTTARRLLLVLNEREYRWLTHEAERDTRSPDQQAIHLLRQALRRPPRSSPSGRPGMNDAPAVA